LRFDNGREYVHHDTSKFLSENGVVYNSSGYTITKWNC